VADEAQIAAMYPLLESRLKTPHGYRLVTAHDLRRVEPSVASAEYFPGDRENGAVFKHASLMAVLALFQAASQVKDITLAAAMTTSAWNMIDLAAPYRTVSDPYILAGNPRFCTQYNNSETGENIGPLLSGTASWSTLALRRGFGVELNPQGLHLDPLLREQDEEVRVDLTWQTETYQITYRKPLGFVRTQDHAPTVTVDGQVWVGSIIPRIGANTVCCIEVTWSI
jgi:cellobiose phosphorylase